jgi:hypothetical protein
MYMNPDTRSGQFPGHMMDYPADLQWVREQDGRLWVPDG